MSLPGSRLGCGLHLLLQVQSWSSAVDTRALCSQAEVSPTCCIRACLTARRQNSTRLPVIPSQSSSDKSGVCSASSCLSSAPERSVGVHAHTRLYLPAKNSNSSVPAWQQVATVQSPGTDGPELEVLEVQAEEIPSKSGVQGCKRLFWQCQPSYLLVLGQRTPGHVSVLDQQHMLCWCSGPPGQHHTPAATRYEVVC